MNDGGSGRRTLPTVVIDGVEFGMDIRLMPIKSQFALRARHVLNDAVRALELLEATNDMRDARIQYFALVALLRAVGHVLDKADGGKNERVKAASNARFAEMKADRESCPLFFEFIEAERNLILKEYNPLGEMCSPTPVLIASDGSVRLPDAQPFPMFIFESGRFNGQDGRDLAAEAIAFWDEYLGDIELECFGKSFAQGVGEA